MYASKLRAAAIALGATLTLSACVGPYGDIGVGYGSGGYYGGYGSGGYYGSYGGYSPYGYGSYGSYGSPYGYSSYGYSPYGYSPYGGWYDNYYYPGTGYYVYSRDGSRQRWNGTQQRYWESRRQHHDRDRTSSAPAPSPTTTMPATTSDGSRWQGRRNRDMGVAPQREQVRTERAARSERYRSQATSDSGTTSSSVDVRPGRRRNRD